MPMTNSAPRRLKHTPSPDQEQGSQTYCLTGSRQRSLKGGGAQRKPKESCFDRVEFDFFEEVKTCQSRTSVQNFFEMLRAEPVFRTGALFGPAAKKKKTNRSSSGAETETRCRKRKRETQQQGQVTFTPKNPNDFDVAKLTRIIRDKLRKFHPANLQSSRCWPRTILRTFCPHQNRWKDGRFVDWQVAQLFDEAINIYDPSNGLGETKLDKLERKEIFRFLLSCVGYMKASPDDGSEWGYPYEPSRGT